MEEWESWLTEFKSRIGGENACILDGIRYHKIDRWRYPSTYVEVPVEMIGFSIEKAKVSAGIVGFRGSNFQPDDEKSGEIGDVDGGKLNTVQPESGWWLFEDELLSTT